MVNAALKMVTAANANILVVNGFGAQHSNLPSVHAHACGSRLLWEGDIKWPCT